MTTSETAHSPRRARFEVYRDRASSYRWRLVAANGETVAQSESYTRRGDAIRGCRDLSNCAKKAADNIVAIDE